MEKYYATTAVPGVDHVYDSNTRKNKSGEVCTVYSMSTALLAKDIVTSLNMAYELRQLAPSATKKQMQEIINKYR